jgi:hypothetical protein
MADQSETTTGTVAVAERPVSAEQPQVQSAPPPSGEKPAQPDAPSEAKPSTDVKALIAGFSDTEKADLLRSLDPDEMFRLDERLSGRMGRAAQKIAKDEIDRLLPSAVDAEITKRMPQLTAQIRDLDDWQNLENQRQQALRDGDAVLALEILGRQQARSQAVAQQQQRQTVERAQMTERELDAAWDDAKAYFLSEAVPQEVRTKLGGKQYGENARKALNAFWADMAVELGEYSAEAKVKERTPALLAKLREELTPALKKEILAAINGGEPSPDTSSGGAASLRFRQPG